MFSRVMKKRRKIRPMYPKCEACGVDLIPQDHLISNRTLCTVDALLRGVKIDKL